MVISIIFMCIILLKYLVVDDRHLTTDELIKSANHQFPFSLKHRISFLILSNDITVLEFHKSQIVLINKVIEFILFKTILRTNDSFRIFIDFTLCGLNHSFDYNLLFDLVPEFSHQTQQVYECPASPDILLILNYLHDDDKKIYDVIDFIQPATMFHFNNKNLLSYKNSFNIVDFDYYEFRLAVFNEAICRKIQTDNRLYLHSRLHCAPRKADILHHFSRCQQGPYLYDNIKQLAGIMLFMH